MQPSPAGLTPNNQNQTDEFRLAVVQMTSTDRVDLNLQSMIEHLDVVAAGGGADLVSFPENALFLRIRRDQPIVNVELKDACFTELSRWSQTNDCAIHVGATPLLQNGVCTNATVLLTPDGERLSPYSKIHLFDVDLGEGLQIRESESFARGKTPFVWHYRSWSFGLSVCYDVRFAELYSLYARQGVDCLLVPSAFTVPTGQAHWEILLRARAIESQCYLVAAAQAGVHRSSQQGPESRSSYGHSLVVDPWGRVLAEAERDQQVLLVKLARSEIQRVRRQIPMGSHRRH